MDLNLVCSSPFILFLIFFHRNYLNIVSIANYNSDFLTVNETSPEPPIEEGKEGVNSASSLSREATFINQSFSQQILSRVIFGTAFQLTHL